MDDKMKYEVAMSKLETIVKEIGSGNISVDELAEKLKEAKSLFACCEERLKQVEIEVAKMLEK